MAAWSTSTSAAPLQEDTLYKAHTCSNLIGLLLACSNFREFSESLHCNSSTVLNTLTLLNTHIHTLAESTPAYVVSLLLRDLASKDHYPGKLGKVHSFLGQSLLVLHNRGNWIVLLSINGTSCKFSPPLFFWCSKIFCSLTPFSSDCFTWQNF